MCLSVCASVVRALMPRVSRLCLDVRTVADVCRSAVKESSVEGDRDVVEAEEEKKEGKKEEERMSV